MNPVVQLFEQAQSDKEREERLAAMPREELERFAAEIADRPVDASKLEPAWDAAQGALRRSIEVQASLKAIQQKISALEAQLVDETARRKGLEARLRLLEEESREEPGWKVLTKRDPSYPLEAKCYVKTKNLLALTKGKKPDAEIQVEMKAAPVSKGGKYFVTFYRKPGR